MKYVLILLLLSVFLVACTTTDKPIACTEEAKICSDGTAVSRDGNNNCEFSACPDERSYVSTDLEQCKVIRFMCVQGKQPFTDDNGCGCEPVNLTGITILECTGEIKTCIDGSILHRDPANNCEFPACPEGKLQAIDCPVERPEACTKEYVPVCGQVQVQCIRAPCPPIMMTFSNKCEACANSLTISYTEGACKDDKEAQCISIGGTYIPEGNECTGITIEQCTSIDGQFNECASACRNDPTAEVCTMQCVQVCEFKKL